MAGSASPPRPGVTARAVLLGLLLIPVNCYWIMDGLMSGQTRPTTVSLFVNVVATLFLVVLANALIAKIAPRHALSHGEQVVIYTLVCIGSALSSLDLMQPLVALVAGPHWLASPENRWQETWLHDLPSYLAVTDLDALEGFFGGHSTIWRPEHLRAWLPSFAVWGSFTFVLSLGMLCLNVLVRKDWTEKSKLSFPIVQLPLELTRPGFWLLKSKLLWVGFAVAAFLDLMNGLHFLYPVLPTLGGQFYDLQQQFLNRPLNAIGWSPIGLLPFAVGLGFFIPLDLAFSCWFFYLFWKVERVLGAMTGWSDLPRFPYVEDQSLAAYVAFCVYCLWVSRTHLRGVWLRVIRRPGGIDDSAEPLSYRTALVGILVAGALLVGFSRHVGMSLWVAAVFFVAYYAVSTAISRMRAEVGSPVHDLHLGGPHIMLANTLGSGILGTRNLAILSFYQFFNRAYRGHLMPHLLEGFKLGEQTKVDQRRFAWAMIAAMVVGIVAAFWSLVDVSYRSSGRPGYATESFSRLMAWIASPQPPNYGSISAVGVGAAATVLLMWLRLRFVWWPLHPAGFAVSGSWSMNLFWVSLLVAWALKAGLIRYAGMQSYRKAMPFFMGLILGEFVLGSFWNLYGCLRHLPMYNFLP